MKRFLQLCAVTVASLAIFGNISAQEQEYFNIWKKGEAKPIQFYADDVIEVNTVDDVDSVSCSLLVKTGIGFIYFDISEVDSFGITTTLEQLYNNPPCAALCDNEFAIKTLNIKGYYLTKDTEVYFASGRDANGAVKYDLKASIEVTDLNTIKVEVPEGYIASERLLIKGRYGESLSEFVFHDESNLLITRDDEAYLDKFLGAIPDEDDKNFRKAQYMEYFTSEENNGDFTVFADMDFKSLVYNSWSENSNPNQKVKPKYSTVFGPYADDIFDGKLDISDMTLKFEICVPSEHPMYGGFSIGFFDTGVWDDIYALNTRGYCAVWCPSRLTVIRPTNMAWSINQVNYWHTKGEWITVSVPMSEFILNMKAGGYCAAWGNEGIRYNYGADLPYGYMGDMENGKSYAEVFPLKKTAELTSATEYDRDAIVALCEEEEYAIPNADYVCDEVEIPTVKKELIRMYQEGHGNPWSGICFNINPYDQPSFDFYQCLFGIDNVRIVPNDGNGFLSEYMKLAKTGWETRDFYNRPVMRCK